MTLSDIREERAKQLTAIEIELATARDYIQDDLKEKFGYGENKFFYNDLVEYRINNSLEDIAEDLDLEERYGLTTDKVALTSVSYAFRGHHNEDFKPEYQFEGLFSEEMNDMIEKIRKSKGGLIGGLIGGQATIETHGDQMRNGGLIGGLIGGRKLASMINPETEERYVVEAGRKGNEAQGFHVFSLEEIADIHTFREESIGKGRYKTLPCWNDTTSNMNEKYGENWSTKKVTLAYHRNKDKLPEEEE
jgi:hypothetical protein